LLALALGVLLLSVAGRGAAYPPHLAAIKDGHAGLPNWSLAMVEALRQHDVPLSSHGGAIVFGLVPSARLVDVTGGYVGMVDYTAMESLRFLGIAGAVEAPVKSALAGRRMTEVCRYLLDFPDSLRVTGPNVAAGPQWIIASGCPADIVRPSQWIRLQLGSAWLERSPWDRGPSTFPTFAAVKASSAHHG
jgi:hypothetical protein